MKFASLFGSRTAATQPTTAKARRADVLGRAVGKMFEPLEGRRLLSADALAAISLTEIGTGAPVSSISLTQGESRSYTLTATKNNVQNSLQTDLYVDLSLGNALPQGVTATIGGSNIASNTNDLTIGNGQLTKTVTIVFAAAANANPGTVYNVVLNGRDRDNIGDTANSRIVLSNVTVGLAFSEPVLEETSISLTAGNSTYNGSAYNGATATLSPEAAGSATLTYYAGTLSLAQAQAASPLSGAPTNAGPYTVVATYAGNGTTHAAADPVSANFTIARRTVTGSITADNKTYDATTDAVVHAGSLVNAIAGDDVTLVASDGAFADADAGVGKVVTATLSLTGADAGNYTLSSSTAQTTANIARATLTGFARTQDALNIAKQGSLTIDISSISGLQGADTIANVFGSATFALQVGGSTFTFQPSVSILTASDGGQIVQVSYSLRGGTGDAALLRSALTALDAQDGGASTSASNASYSTMWIRAESTNYSLADDFFTRLFSSSR